MTNARRLAAALLFLGALGALDAPAIRAACPTCPQASFGRSPRSFDVGQTPNYMVAGDFDGDGRLDLVTRTALFRGLPGGGLAAPIPIAFYGTPPKVIAADLDGDGRLDLLASDTGLGLFIGNGDGTFAPPVRYYPSSAYVYDFAVGDVNGDGLPDIVETIYNGYAVMLNLGSGVFTAPIEHTESVYGALFLGDFNGDQKLDLYIGNQLLLGAGDGTFVNTFATLPYPAAVADFNHDGKLDLVLTGAGGLSLAHGRGDGSFDPPVVIDPNSGLSHLVIGDFNGDGWPDVAAISYPSQLVLERSDGAGGFQAPLVTTAFNAADLMLAADFDGDGRSDLAISYYFDAFARIVLTDPDGSPRLQTFLPGNDYSIASADLNGDGKKDLLVGGSGVAVWIGDGSGGFTAGFTDSAPTQVRSVAIADVNNDGYRDLLTVSWGPSSFPTDGSLRVYLGDGAGGFTPLPSVPLDFAPNVVRAVHLNADAYPDLLVAGVQSGIRVWTGNGDGTFTTGATLAPGASIHDILVADFGRGKLDVVGAAYADGSVIVFPGNGDATFQAGTSYPGGGPFWLTAADFNSDGKLDILGDGGAGYVLLRGRGDGTFEPSFSFPAPGPSSGGMVAADFNGDGRTDLVIAGSDVRAMTGKGDGTFATSTFYAVQGTPLGMVADDFNGDGKPDVAVATYSGVSILLNTNCAARRLDLQTLPASCAAPGAPLAPQPIAQVLDDGGNPVACAAGTVSAALVPGTGTAGAVLGGTTSKPLVGGAASFTNLSIDLAGDGYALELTDAPLRSVRSGPISVHASLSTSITGPSSFCPPASASYSADPGFDSYLWSVDGAKVGGGRTLQLPAIPNGPHTLSVLASRLGCSASASMPISVGVVPPIASNSGPVCVGDTIQLTASSVPGGVYAWTGPNGFVSSQQNPTISNATLLAGGQYSVSVTVGGCTSPAGSTNVAVHLLPYRPLASNDGPRCAGQTLQLSVSPVPGASYSWTGPNGFTSSIANPTIASATPADSGVYSVTVTLDGCVSPPATTSVVIAACQELPVSLSADASGNGILEPGETVTLAPSWMNTTGSPAAVSGTATSFTGPAGATYSLSDATADYGYVVSGATSSCDSTGDCYAVGVSAPATRPLLHWDAAFSESLSTGDAKSWSLHIGASFTDVPSTLPFYRFVETLLHRGVTGGCGGTAYCPASSVTRAQMAVFLLVSQAGAGYVPPPATGLFADVPIASPFAAWVEELSRRGVTAGCGNGNYCPAADVTRRQMAVFLLVAREGSSYTPPAPIGVFADVPAGNPFAPWIEELFHRGITGGCGNGNYCPADPVSRGQMAVLLTATFGLSLGGP